MKALLYRMVKVHGCLFLLELGALILAFLILEPSHGKILWPIFIIYLSQLLIHTVYARDESAKFLQLTKALPLQPHVIIAPYYLSLLFFVVSAFGLSSLWMMHIYRVPVGEIFSVWPYVATGCAFFAGISLPLMTAFSSGYGVFGFFVIGGIFFGLKLLDAPCFQPLAQTLNKWLYAPSTSLAITIAVLCLLWLFSSFYFTVHLYRKQRN